MEILYTMKAKFSLSEFKRFVWALTFKSKGTIIKLALLEIALLAIGIIVDNYIFVTFAVLYPFIIWLIQNRQIKKIYNSNELMKDAEAEYNFCETCFSSDNPGGNSSIEYEKLYEVVETKTNFYLMIAKNQGFMLKKADMPQGLEGFLREKAVWINAKTKRKK